MKRVTLLSLVLFTQLGLAQTGAFAAPSGDVILAQIRGTINPATSNYLKSAIQKAEGLNVQALVVELDTPGGLISSVQEMAQSIDRSRIPVILYVSPAGAAATSAGALLALASHLVVMAPGSHIGAAHPVDSSGKEIAGAMGEKVLNDTVAFARGLAERRGRNLGIAEAIVRKSQSFTAQEAFKEKIADVLAEDLSDLLNQVDSRTVVLSQTHQQILQTRDAKVIVHAMSLGQRVLQYLANPNIATLLMSLAMLLIYFELSSPGVGIPGVLGTIFLIVAFVSFQMLPIRTGGLVLLFLGLGLLAAEPFVLGHGAFALGGVISFVLGILWIMDPTQPGLRISPSVWLPITVFLGGGAAAIGWFALRTQEDSAAERKRMGGGGASGLAGYLGEVQWVEEDGKTGKVLVRGETWDFSSEESTEMGQRVEILKTEGRVAQVRKKL